MLRMKAWMLKRWELASWDRLGMGLSILCALHCILTPVMILSIPLLARYYLAHPLFHFLLALLIIPVGLIAFFMGIRKHHNWKVLILGLPGLILVTLTPYVVHVHNLELNEPALMVIGSVMLVSAHLLNRKSCLTCEIH